MNSLANRSQRMAEDADEFLNLAKQSPGRLVRSDPAGEFSGSTEKRAEEGFGSVTVFGRFRLSHGHPTWGIGRKRMKHSHESGQVAPLPRFRFRVNLSGV